MSLFMSTLHLLLISSPTFLIFIFLLVSVKPITISKEKFCEKTGIISQFSLVLYDCVTDYIQFFFCVGNIAILYTVEVITEHKPYT